MEKQNAIYPDPTSREQHAFPAAAEAQHSIMNDEQAALDADALLQEFEADYRRMAQ